MRLNKYLAKTGIGSRRECDLYIRDGLIKINGKITRDYSYKVADIDSIQFKNKYINLEENNYYYVLHKPKGYVCSSKDEFNRKIIYDLIPCDFRLFSVGRLDYDTTGIIFLTNDGDFSQVLTHPKYQITKKYYVITDLNLSNKSISLIKKGIKIDKYTMRADVKFLEHNKKGYFWEIIMTEGKNREIKQIFNKFNINVLRLHRYEFAGIKLENLKVGKYRLLNKNELIQIKKIINK